MIRSLPANDAYRNGWDALFGDKEDGAFLREPSADAYEIVREDCGACPNVTLCNVAAACLRRQP